jgi:sigma-B regulation protein RsbU (phosphoserine phosphatase)
MATLVFLVLFLAALAAVFAVLWHSTRRIAESERAHAELQVEENRVFDFLHGLGEAFSEGVRSSELHRLIVESAIRILDAQGGVLYLVDRTETNLVPAFLSKGCPPLVDVPDHIMKQAATMPIAVDSYVRLHPIKIGEGLIGEVCRQLKPRFLTAADFPSNAGREKEFQVDTALIGSLTYRRKCLGVLVVANGTLSAPFTQKDVNVFHNICEQSAFALYNEAVYIEANEKKRLDHDIEIAREIQSILLPSDPPPVPGYEISGINIPARQVSGDYFDYIVVDEHRTGVAIADVSGKGIPASLIMAMCRSVIRSQAPGKLSAAEVLRSVNRQLYPDIKEDMFISMAYLILDGQTADVCLARAGHDPPFLYRAADRDLEKINPKGMAMGIDSGEVFDRVCADFRFTLEKDDCILLYTDGATEALDEKGLEFGMAKLVQGLQASADSGAPAIIRRLTEDLKSFVGAYPQHDDITLIAIRKL